MDKKYLWRPLIYCLVLLVEETLMQDAGECPPINSTRYDTEWPSTSISTSSKPPCVNEAKEFMYRKCIDGYWGDEPSCFYVQPQTIPDCPEGFRENDNICYTFSPKSTYPPQCPFNTTIPFNSYKDVVGPLREPIWLPVKRDSSNNGLGFLKWREASALYRTDYTDRVFVDGNIKGKDCVLYYNSTYSVMTYCNETHSGVCAYYKLDHSDYRLCASYNSILCRQSDFGSQAKCFCLANGDQSTSEFKKVEFLKIYQNNIYKTLTSDKCAIGLGRNTNGTYIWMNSNKEIDYTYWSTEVEFNNDNIYGAATADGWILTKTPSSCLLFEQEINLEEPILDISFNSKENHLILKVTNVHSLKYLGNRVLVYCFTNAGSLNLIYRYEQLIEDPESDNVVAKFYIEPHKYGPGHYWCESFKYFDSEPIKSQVIFVNQSDKFGFEFIAILKVQYVRGTDPLSKDIIEFLERIFFIKLDNNDDEYKYTSRIMKILDVDEDRVTLNVHFTYNVSNETLPQEDDEFARMKNKIVETLRQLEVLQIEMIDFLSATYCHVDNIWPKTKIGQYASGVYCFKLDGIRMKRLCGGNFIDGARWVQDEECEIPSRSTITDQVLEILDGKISFLDGICDIILRYEEFGVFDIYLIVELVKQHLDEIDVNTFVEIIDSILKIERYVLVQAQHKMRVLDRLLDVIDKEAKISSIESQNFVTVLLSGKNRCGVALDKWNKIIQNISLDEMLEKDDIQCVIWLCSDFHNQNEEEKIVFKFFFNDLLFVEPESDIRRAITSVGVLFPNEIHKVRIYHQSNLWEDCAFWSYNLSDSSGRGKWVNTGKSTNLSSFTFCDFDNTTTVLSFITSTGPNQGISEDLQTILDSNNTASEKISELLLISERYGDFSSYDVYLVGEILKKVGDDKDIKLEELVQIISNLHEIKRPILSNSQNQTRSTDVILHCVDAIVKNQNYATVTSRNFFVFITDLRETNFTGLLLLGTNETLQVQELRGNISVDDILKIDNFESAVLISSGLKEQMEEEATVIITIFSNDGLFNEKATKPKMVSKVFGVILPEMKKFLEPIIVIHKVSNIENYEKDCVHWKYSKNIPGTWAKDNDGKSLPYWSQCEFWHTTHFALLLLDEDKYDYILLDWITLVNSVLSALGLSCFLLTAILFKRWRANTGNQILLNFAFAILLQIGVFYASSTINQNSDDYFICTIIGIALHYSVVSQFCWMFVIAILQFKRFVEVFGGPPKYILLKACLCGWVLPCLPVISVYVLDNMNYVSGKVGLCYPSGLGLYLGVWLPVVIVVIINLVIFLFIIYSVVHRKTECLDAGNREAMFQWRLAVLLFFMLGLTWAFGFLSELDFGVVFVYAFCITATLQGFVMFLFFIVFNANTRYLYTQGLKKCCSTKNY